MTSSCCMLYRVCRFFTFFYPWLIIIQWDHEGNIEVMMTTGEITRATLKWWWPQSVSTSRDGVFWEQSSNRSGHPVTWPCNSCCAGVTLASSPGAIKYKLCLLVVPRVGRIHPEPVDSGVWNAAFTPGGIRRCKNMEFWNVAASGKLAFALQRVR